MTRKGKEISMMELCKVFQDRNKLIFGERAQPARQQRPVNDTNCTKTYQVKRKMTRITSVQQHDNEVFSTQCRKHDQLSKPQPARRLPKLYVARSNDAEQRDVSTASQFPAPQFRTQKQRRINTQKVMVREMNKPSLPPTLDVDLRTGGRGETFIHKQRCRRHGMEQLFRGVPEDGHDQVNIRMITENEAVIVQHRKSQAVVKQAELLMNKNETEGHRNVQKHLETATSHDIQTRSSRTVTRNMNQGMQGRRVAVQNGSTYHECSTRRNGVRQTNSTQQELAFIRVLRKRF